MDLLVWRGGGKDFFVVVFHEASKELRVRTSTVTCELTNVPSITEAVTARRMDAS